MDRRDFLTTSLMSVAVLKVVTPAAAAPAPVAPVPVPSFSAAQFRTLIGSRFQLTASGWRGDVRLAEVRPGPESARLEQFSTVFVPDGSSAPAAGLYQISHPAAGRFMLRIDGQDPSGQRAAMFALLRG